MINHSGAKNVVMVHGNKERMIDFKQVLWDQMKIEAFMP